MLFFIRCRNEVYNIQKKYKYVSIFEDKVDVKKILITFETYSEDIKELKKTYPQIEVYRELDFFKK